MIAQPDWLDRQLDHSRQARQARRTRPAALPLERVREELQWLRSVFQVLSVAMAGLVAYIVQPTTDPLRAVAALVGLVATSGLLAAVIRTIYQRLSALTGGTHELS
jgi:hypothetical protein